MKKFTLLLMAAALVCGSAMAQNRVKNVYTFSSRLNVSELQVPAQTVQLHRTLLAGYNTLCLPMSLDAEQLQAAAPEVQVERLAAIRQEGATLQLLFVDCTNEGIEAGMPYLVFSPTRQYLHAKNTEANAIDTEIKTVRMDDGKGNQVSFSSSWTSRQKNGLYGIPAKQNVEILESVLVRTTEELSFLPTRCGFSWEQQAPSAEKLEIVHVSPADVTAIKELKQKGTTDNRYYDLNGRNINKPSQKGVYIHEGKQVIVK